MMLRTTLLRTLQRSAASAAPAAAAAAAAAAPRVVPTLGGSRAARGLSSSSSSGLDDATLTRAKALNVDLSGKASADDAVASLLDEIEVLKGSKLLGGVPIRDAEDISHIAFSFMAAKALFAALDISLFTALHRVGGPVEYSDLAAVVNEGVAASEHVDERKLVTLVTALTSVGLLKKEGSTIANVPASEAFLVRGAKYDFGDYLRFQIDKQMYPFMDHVSSVLQGKPSKQRFVDYEEWMGDPEEARLYTESQHAGSHGPARSLARYKGALLNECTTLLDVGGGSGGFSLTLASLFPNLKCTVMDFPNVIEVGREYAEADGMSDRVDFVGGNALETPFPTDKSAVLMSYLSSSVGGDNLEELYTKAYDALEPGGIFVVHDFMVNDERDGPPLAALWALQHMVFTPGAISLTPAAVTGFMQSAGFEDIEFFTMIPGMTQGAIGIKK